MCIMKTVRTYCQTRNISHEEYLQTGNTVKILKTEEGYCDLFTEQPSITTHTRAGARWKENSLKYMEEGME